MAQRKQIEHLPPGWYWVPKGEGQWTYTNRKGQTVRSTQKHGLGPNGETLSVRQVQNRQRAERERLGQAKPPTVPRTGRTRTITQKSFKSHPRFDHGLVKTYIYRDLATLRRDVANDPKLTKGFRYGILKIKYDKRITGNDDSPPRKKRGFASLTGFTDTKDWVDWANQGNMTPPDNPEGNPWVESEKELSNYQMTSSSVRYEFQVFEK